MAKLIIVESPNKTKSIQKYLGKDYVVKASVGHVRDLPKSTLGVDVEKNFAPSYKVLSGKRKVINELKAEAKKCDNQVYLATDPDREGEAIAWHLAHELGMDTSALNRVTFNEITKSGVQKGMENPRSIDMDLVDAQQARRILDRLVGYKISPILWKKVRYGISAGRVQSVALKLIVEREKEIKAFVPQEYWTIDAELLKGTKAFTAHLHSKKGEKKIEIENKAQADEVLNAIDGKPFIVSKVTKGKKTINPAPPFKTSTMQQEAARKYGFSGQRTMTVAQQLYEGVDVPGIGTTGLITYMRTDSLRISEEARKAGSDYILGRWGKDYLPEKQRYYKASSDAQDAHEAIRPTLIDMPPEKLASALTADQLKLYRLIWSRFIAGLMASSIRNTVKCDIEAGDYIFKASGYNVAFDGFTVLYTENKDEAEKDTKMLPELVEGEVLDLKQIIPEQHYTQPPARYNEASIIEAMESYGIGRPSTYATIISNLIIRTYIEKEKKTLVPTNLGMVVSDFLDEWFTKIMDVKFTAGMETQLDEISEGKRVWNDVIADFYKDFEVTLATAEKSLDGKKIKVPDEETDEVCELCGKKMLIKTSRFGKFLGCSDYPNCKFTKPLAKDIPKEPCPKCGSTLVKRLSKNKKYFYGCSAYPECDFSAPGAPTGEKCEECGSFIVKGSRGSTYCMNSECPTRQKNEYKGKKATKGKK